jgi:hypothetical protein
MIYISLTTVPDRLNFEQSSRINLESLLNQKTDKEYKVLYNVPFKYTGKLSDEKGRLPQNTDGGEIVEIPEWINKLAQENNKLIINRLKDYGPPTKIVGALLYTNNPDDVLICCDDDQEYHEEMLEYHLSKLSQYPNCAIAFRGDRLYEKREWIENDVKKYTFTQISDNFPVTHDVNLAITGHWHSVGYKRSFFKDDFLDEDFIFKNHWSDDIIMAYYVIKHKLEIKCVAWDKETDFRLVNTNGRPSNSFPVVKNLPFHNAGCHVLRNITGTHVNDQATYPQDWVNQILDYYSGKIHIDG